MRQANRFERRLGRSERVQIRRRSRVEIQNRIIGMKSSEKVPDFQQPASLDFDKIDPSDAMENFLHRGNFKASRKTGAFQPITPLTPADIPQTSTEDMSFSDLAASVQRMREDLQPKRAALAPPNAPDPQPSPTL
jgi:hypothetical protein